MNCIRNQHLTLCVKPSGAELCSLRSADGFETLWQADPSVWRRHAPVLFPIVGKLRNDHYTLNGTSYTMTAHGFARDLDFTLIEQSESSLTYQLLSTEKTRALYPFEFILTLAYRLSDNTLTIEYIVRNTGSCVMPFSIGAHPGFTLPGPIDDCFLEFEKPETLHAHLLEKTGLLSSKTVPVWENTKRLPLSKNLFDRNALIFLKTESKKITLGANGNPRRLTVEFEGFPQLGIWSKPGAPFVCIEPWFGYADPEQPYGDIWNKPGILKLPAGETFTCTHRIVAE